MYQIDSEALHAAVVTDVLLSNDGKKATIIVDCSPSTLELLTQRYRVPLNQAFRRQFERKIVPTLDFILDDGTQSRIDTLLDQATTP